MAQATRPSFTLDPQLKRDCIHVGDLALCRVLLMNDAQYPWLILVPRVAGVSEIYQLSLNDQQQLMRESSALSEAMAGYFEPDKMNLANLGNIVSQLHLHLVARFRDDPAWPGPVWGHGRIISYEKTKLKNQLPALQKLVSKIKAGTISDRNQAHI